LKRCDAIEGIIEEGKEIIQEDKGSPALDAGLLAAAQAVEHYEIARYGTLKAWAKKLGHQQAVSLLDQTLREEAKTDADLTKIAETAVNAEAEL
jgi:ferritin-like metal-binding protein YciE